MPCGDSTDLLLSPRTYATVFKPSCPCLEKPIKIRARSASDLSFTLLHLAWPHLPRFAGPSHATDARIDVSGTVKHPIGRGIGRREVFSNDQDSDFLKRLSRILSKTQRTCYERVLIPNHFNLLLRTGVMPLSNIMSRLLTGYSMGGLMLQYQASWRLLPGGNGSDTPAKPFSLQLDG